MSERMLSCTKQNPESYETHHRSDVVKPVGVQVVRVQVDIRREKTVEVGNGIRIAGKNEKSAK
jgi:hypothetical protein